jgi:hypothetical protein
MTIRKYFSFLFPFCFLLLLLSGCGGGKPSEKEQYEDLRSSFKYKSYKTLSKGTITFIADNYNKTVDSSQWKVKEPYIRLMLGYYWAISDQPAFAFAEADVISENSQDQNLGCLASMLNSCTMYQQGWTGLAKEESGKGMALASTSGDKDMLETETMIFHLLMGTVCVQQKNMDAAKFHFAGFAAISGVDLPYKLADVMADIQKGNLQQGLQKARLLASDPAVPEIFRTELGGIIAEVEKKGGDVNSSMFWPKTFGSLIMDELKSSSKKGASGLMKIVDKAAGKLS